MIGARFVRDVENGEIVVIAEKTRENPTGIESHKPFPPQPARPCIFEYIYFARPDSVVHGRNVYDVRKKMGAQLAREASVDADVVVPVPDSGVPAAIGYAQESGVPVRARDRAQPLCRTHFHSADPIRARARRQA